MKDAKAQAKQLKKSAEENNAFLRRTGSVVTPLPVPDVVVAPLPVPDVVVAPPPRPARRVLVPAPDVVVVIGPAEAPEDAPVVVEMEPALLFNTPPYVHRGDRAVPQNTRVRPPHPFDHIDVVAVAEVHHPPRNVVPRLPRNVRFLLDEGNLADSEDNCSSLGFEDENGTWSK